MSSLPSAPMVGASVQLDTNQVMAWVCSPGQQLAHLIPLPPASAREWARQLNDAAAVAEQLQGSEQT